LYSFKAPTRDEDESCGAQPVARSYLPPPTTQACSSQGPGVSTRPLPERLVVCERRASTRTTAEVLGVPRSHGLWVLRRSGVERIRPFRLSPDLITLGNWSWSFRFAS
jgi:hypothetical protein